MEYSVTTLTEFEQVTHTIIDRIINQYQDTHHACVICVTGDLGAGKTTMAQIIAQYLGVQESVQSPTFVIKKSYTAHNHSIATFIHMDAYRLEGGASLDPLALDADFARPNTIMIIEWPEIIASVIPQNRVQITIEHTSGGRKIIVQ